MTASATIDAQVPQPRCALRPVIVTADLESLRGPADGLVALPQRLCWSEPGRVFDLSDSDQAAEMYEYVFEAARSADDFAGYVHSGLLTRLWPELDLAPRVRRAWEAAHPLLALAPAA